MNEVNRRPVLIIQNWAAESPGEIGDYLNDRSVHFEVCRTFAKDTIPNPERCSEIIMLGYPNSVNDYMNHEGHKELFSFVADAVRHDRRLLAICYGSQMLAKVLGAEVKPHTEKEIGIYRAILTDEGKNDSLFAGCDSEFDVFHWHGDTFRLPFGATQLVKGEGCPMQAFRHNNQVGIQFHVEPKAEEIPLWCDEYSSELKEVGKTKEQIVKSFTKREKALRLLCHRLLDNFLER